jgi:hypothetical protein
MDWFEKLTGFREKSYGDTRAKLKVEGGQLQSLINGISYGIGHLELVSLEALRQSTLSAGGPVWAAQGKCGDWRCAADASVT